MHNTYGKTFGP